MWNGAFSPSFRKSIGNVRFIPITEMTSRDWAWLDFDGLRETARNRIANLLMTGQLRGFFQVMIVEKAKAKNEYLWPGNGRMEREFQAGDINATDFFRYEPDVDAESEAVDSLERLRARLSLVSLSEILLVVRVLFLVAEQQEQEEIEKVTEDHLNELERDDVTLLVSALMMWELELEEAEAMLDELPESDETDEVRDWINDRVAEIQESREQANSIAAGRGLTKPERMV